FNGSDSSPTLVDCYFTTNSAGGWGGGISNISNGSPLISGCKFNGNTSGLGAGMHNYNCTPTVTGCTFNNNNAGSSGGGLENKSSDASITDCIFRDNIAGDRGGGMNNTDGSSPLVADCNFTDNKAWIRGSGMCNWSATPMVRNCIFTSNTTTIYGGGMSNNSSHALVTNCIFRGNSAMHCGGMHNDWSSPTVTNSVFFNNLADHQGSGTSGAMGQSNHSNPKVTNCTFAYNVAYYGGAMRSTADSSPIVTNCILWSNVANIDSQIAGPAVVTYSNVQGGLMPPGVGNINADPLFVNAGAGNLRLSSSASPCVDKGNNAAPDLPEKDLDGNPRVADGDGNRSAVVDMGAYELAPTYTDTEPPGPNPKLSVEPKDTTHDQITLISTEAYDISGVQYYFQCVSGPGHDSGWVSQSTYTDMALAPDTSYAYRVKARDGFRNETPWSPIIWARTLSEPTVIDGLIAYWAMEDGYGHIASDRSGNGNHGALSSGGNLPQWVAGIDGGALRFDGSGGYVDCGDHPQFHLYNSCTVMAWIRVDSFTNPWQAIVTKGDTAWRLHRHQSSEYIDFACTGLTGGNQAWGSSVWGSTPVTDNEWHHVAGVFNGWGESDQVNLYVDGLLDGAQAVRNGYGYIQMNAYNVYIGENEEQPGRSWNGLIDDVHLYDMPLNAGEINSYVNFGSMPDAWPLAWWQLDEQAGVIAPDASGNGFDGILTAGASPQWQQGPIGGALHLQGAGNYVNCGNDPIFDLTEAMTVSAWINISTVPADWTGIITKGDDAWRLSTSVGTTRMHFAVTGPPEYWAVDGSTDLDPGGWYHIAATYDGDQIRLFVDGVEDGAISYDGGITTNEFDTWIGGNSDRPGREFDGLIDEVAVWNRALSMDEIQNLAALNTNLITKYDIYVPGIGDPGENGTWEHPFDSIQEAIDHADGPETVVVLDGTYTGWGNRNISFRGNDMTVRSENGPENCIVDCQNAARGFYFRDEESPGSILEGFTIVNGSAYTEGWGDGGAIRCYQSSPTIRECIIRNSRARSGGGIHLEFSHATLEYCAIVGNRAVETGGGVGCESSSPTLSFCLIANNTPDGVNLDSETARILGTVAVVSDSLNGAGAFVIEPDATLRMQDALITGDLQVQGLGEIQVPLAKKLTVAQNATIDLTENERPGMRGTIHGDGFLVLRDAAFLTRTVANVTRAVFRGNAVATENTFATNSLIPYGQIALEDSAVFFNNEIFSNGDRYTDVEPNTFTGSIQDIQISVHVDEGRGNLPGGLFELRGEDIFCTEGICEPGLIEVP
ncbi:MAG: LamG-like jellyroll fold domain-containing protein, partial [Planctomycetota bacterium]